MINYIRAISVILALGLTGCSDRVEGTYTLDKTAVKKAMQTALAGQSGGGIVYDFFTRAVDETEMRVDLQADGQAGLRFTLPTGGYAGPKQLKWVTIEDQNGKWTADGANIVIIAAGNRLDCSRTRARLSCQPKKTLLIPVVLTK